jgi:hypothetical protein
MKIQRKLLLRILANLTDDNDFIVISKQNINDCDVLTTSNQDKEYDSDGAMWFVVATILIYALSIMIMIGANLTRSLADDDVKNFLKGYSTLNIKQCEKIKVKEVLNNKGMLENMTPPSTPEVYPTDDTGEIVQKIKTKMFTLPIREEESSEIVEDSSSPNTP